MGDLLRLRLGTLTTISVFSGDGDRTGDVATGLNDPEASTKQCNAHDYKTKEELTTGLSNQKIKTRILLCA